MFIIHFIKILFIIHSSHSFVPPLLSGNVGIGLDLLPVPKSMAYSKIKQDQIKVLKNNGPEYICSEFNEARKILISEQEDIYVSFLIAEKKHLIYSIFYRISSKMPFVYTIESVVRSTDTCRHVSIIDMESILVKQCEGYLQKSNLKTWANGKYHKEKYLEKQFLENDYLIK